MTSAVIDLNVIISAIISQMGIPRQIWSAWLSDQRFALVISEGMILELAGKLATPRIARRYGVRASHVRSTASLLRTVGSLVTVLEDEVAPVTGDPEDDLVLATARLGERAISSRETERCSTSAATGRSQL